LGIIKEPNTVKKDLLLIPGFGLNQRVLNQFKDAFSSLSHEWSIQTYEQASKVKQKHTPYGEKVRQIVNMLEAHPEPHELTIIAHSQGSLVLCLALENLPKHLLPKHILFVEPEFDEIQKMRPLDYLSGTTRQAWWLIKNMAKKSVRTYVASSLAYVLFHPKATYADIADDRHVSSSTVERVMKKLSEDTVSLRMIISEKDPWFFGAKAKKLCHETGTQFNHPPGGSHDWIFAMPSQSAHYIQSLLT
jgi:hypothetical protein